MRNSRWVLPWALILCSACAGSRAPTVPPLPESTATEAATLSVRIPYATPNAHERLPRYMSAGTQSISIAPYFGPVYASFNVASGAPGCTNGPGALTCTFTIKLPVGSYQLRVNAYDQPLSGGATAGQLLSDALVTTTVVKGQANPIDIAMGGHPSSMTMSAPNATITNTGLSSSIPITFQAKDADGYTIVGSDPFDHPIQLLLTEDPYASFQATLSSSQIVSPASTINVNYSGLGLYGFMIAASSSDPNDIRQFGTIAVSTVPEFAPSHQMMFGLAANAGLIALGNNAVWFTEPNEAKLASYPTGLGGALSEFPIPSGNHPGHLALYTFPSQSGIIWFTEDAGYIGEMSFSGANGGAIHEYPLPTSNAGLYDIAAGNYTQDVWFTEHNAGKLGSTNQSGIIREIPVGVAGSAPTGILYGSSGVWFADPGTNSIGTVNGSTVVEYPLPTPNAGPTQCVQLTYLWCNEANVAQVARVSPAGSIDEFPTGEPLTTMATAPGSKIFAFTASGKLEQFDTTSGKYVFYASPFAGDGTPSSLVPGEYGSLYYMIGGSSLSEIIRIVW